MFRDSKENKPATTDVDLKLYRAINSGDSKSVSTALTEGANVEGVIRVEMSMLAMACLQDKNEIAELLIMRGADVNRKDSDGNTALF